MNQEMDYLFKEDTEISGEISPAIKAATPVTASSALIGLALATVIKPAILSAGLGFVVGGGIGYFLYKKVLKK